MSVVTRQGEEGLLSAISEVSLDANLSNRILASDTGDFQFCRVYKLAFIGNSERRAGR